MINLKQGKFAITLICILLGIMLSTQYRSTKNIRLSTLYLHPEDITRRLIDVENERNMLIANINELRQESSSKINISKLGGDLIPLEGPGIIVTLDVKPPISNINMDLYPIQIEHILGVINELKAADAEALSLDDKRLIVSSAIAPANHSIEIKAIGNPITLENALKLRGGPVESLPIWGIKVTIKKQDIVRIPAYEGSYQFKHAKPVQ